MRRNAAAAARTQYAQASCVASTSKHDGTIHVYLYRTPFITQIDTKTHCSYNIVLHTVSEERLPPVSFGIRSTTLTNLWRAWLRTSCNVHFVYWLRTTSQQADCCTHILWCAIEFYYLSLQDCQTCLSCADPTAVSRCSL